MRGRVAGAMRRAAPSPLVLIIVGAGVALLLVGLVGMPRPVRSIDGVGTIDQCSAGWPVVMLEGDWSAALPDEIRARPPAYLPVIEWPAGLHFDEASGDVLDASGSVRFRRGDLVRVRASVVEVHGDPSPCFSIYNLKMDRISPA